MLSAIAPRMTPSLRFGIKSELGFLGDKPVSVGYYENSIFTRQLGDSPFITKANIETKIETKREGAYKVVSFDPKIAIPEFVAKMRKLFPDPKDLVELYWGRNSDGCLTLEIIKPQLKHSQYITEMADSPGSIEQELLLSMQPINELSSLELAIQEAYQLAQHLDKHPLPKDEA